MSDSKKTIEELYIKIWDSMNYVYKRIEDYNDFRDRFLSEANRIAEGKSDEDKFFIKLSDLMENTWLQIEKAGEELDRFIKQTRMLTNYLFMDYRF